MNKVPEISKGLLKILNSPWDNKELINYIQDLFKAKVLSKDEIILCKNIIEQVEVKSSVSISSAFAELKIYCNWERDARYEKKDLQFVSDYYLGGRIESQLREQARVAFKNSGDGVFNGTDTSLFFNRYTDVIGVKQETTLEDFLSPFDKVSIEENNLVLTCESIDKLLNGGLMGGQVTTIFGDSGAAKSLCSLNIAYTAISQGKNVLYFSLGLSKQDLNKRFILRHSYDLKFENELIYDDEEEEFYDKELLEEVCKDFYNNLSGNLIVFDESYFDISTARSLLKLFAVAERDFKKVNQHGIDLIIIDDFTYMKLDNGLKLITTKSKIQDEYYCFLRNQSKNLLGMKRMIPIVVTYSIDKKYYSYFNENDTFGQFMIPEIIESLSDNVLAIRMDNNQQLKITLAKPYAKSDEDYRFVPIDACIQNWYLGYNNEDETLQARRAGLVKDEDSGEPEEFGSISTTKVTSGFMDEETLKALMMGKDNENTSKDVEGSDSSDSEN